MAFHILVVKVLLSTLLTNIFVTVKMLPVILFEERLEIHTATIDFFSLKLFI